MWECVKNAIHQSTSMGIHDVVDGKGGFTSVVICKHTSSNFFPSFEQRAVGLSTTSLSQIFCLIAHHVQGPCAIFRLIIYQKKDVFFYVFLVPDYLKYFTEIWKGAFFSKHVEPAKIFLRGWACFKKQGSAAMVRWKCAISISFFV